MAFDENRAKVLRAAGAASAAAPYVRRIVSDDELRRDVRTLVAAGRHLYEGLTADGVSKLLDDDVREDLDSIVASLQGASERVIHPRRSSHWGSWLIGGTLIGGALAGFKIGLRGAMGRQAEAGPRPKLAARSRRCAGPVSARYAHRACWTRSGDTRRQLRGGATHDPRSRQVHERGCGRFLATRRRPIQVQHSHRE